MALTIGRDHEEDVFEVQLKEHSETSKYVHGGLTTVLTRTCWLDPNGQSQYNSEWLYLYPDGAYSWVVDGDSFQFAIGQRRYSSAPARGCSYEATSRSVLRLGYRVTRFPKLSYSLSPDPRPVKIDWFGSKLATSPAGTECDRLVSGEYAAPRHRFVDIAFPEPDFEIRTIMVARDTSRPTTESANSNAPPEMVGELEAVTLADQHRRLRRHLNMRHYLLSPVRNTQECQAVARLCREAGYEPWMIMPAYNLAYEYTKVLRRKETNAEMHPPQYRQQFLEADDAMWLEQARDTERRLKVKFTPAFLEALRTTQATMLRGMPKISVEPSEVLYDRLDWDHLETVQLPSTGR